MTDTSLFDWASAQRQAARQLGQKLIFPEPAAGYADWRQASALVASAALATRARVVAISGSQGSGKSTLAQCLQNTLINAGQQAAALSIDDFYLTRQARASLAEQVHPLLQTRGVPGTHDWQWLQQVLDEVHRGNRPLQVPVFDKGLDDRVAQREIDADLLVFEGWCLGVRAQPESALAAPCNELERDEDGRGEWRHWVNDQLQQHYESLWQKVDLWVHLRVPGFAQVQAWRSQQEQQIPLEQRMDEAQIRRFIAHYQRLTEALWQQRPDTPGFVLQLDEQHQVTEVTVSLKP
ncbi:MAG: hypothetical protein NXH95_04685 [Pseudomonadaceae bacterium]|nr:hypothetical protein [Pseudomonadaceae bacterium]